MSTDASPDDAAARQPSTEGAPLDGPAADPATAVEPSAPATTGASAEVPPAVRPSRASVWWRRAVIAVVAVALWLGSAYFYAASGGSSVTEPPPIDDGVYVSVDPVKIDPGANAMQLRLSFLPVGDYATGADAELTQPVVLRLYLTTGLVSTTRFEAGQPMRPIETEVYLDGEFVRYPFDRYTSSWGLSMSSPGSGDQPASPVPIGLYHGGSAAAWRLLVNAESAVDGDATAVGFAYELWRSPVTVAFALLLLGLMVTLAVLGTVVASKVHNRKARVEATMASWFGAMIFALVPLRTFLPGAPPVGAWVDVLVLFWVMLVLVAGLAVFLATWWRTAPPGPAPGDRRGA